ncbi:MAG: tetratricopeptide repeat protein [Acidobacteria bacterium]|nr:tetratricopeptide repeat protein [Acidobacteriota bacterium]
MTGAVLRKLDAKQRAMYEKTARRQDESLPPEKKDAASAGPSKPAVNITSLHKLAVAYHTQKRYEEAERLYQEALVAMTATVAPSDPEFAQLLNNIGRLYFEQMRYKEAEPLYSHSLALVEESLGRDHPKVARRLVNLADLYFAIGKHSEADAYYRRAVSIDEKAFGPKHHTTVSRLRSYAVMLRNMDKIAEAEAVEARAYFPRTERDRRSARERRVQEVPTALQGISVPGRRRTKDRRTGKGRRRS